MLYRSDLFKKIFLVKEHIYEFYLSYPMTSYKDQVEQAAEFLKKKGFSGEMGIVLGSGLGELADAFEDPMFISYEDIPGFPRTTAAGHEGKLICGTIEGVKVIGLKGRKHYYEVANHRDGMKQVVFPMHVLASLGVKTYFATNAVGGLHPKLSVGDIVIVRSHISMLPDPLLGAEDHLSRIDGGLAPRFQPMNDAYDPALRSLLRQITGAFEGVYMAVTGPSYETEAECVAYRDSFGADTVGMSLAPEIIVARNRGMRCVAFNLITNTVKQDGTNAANHEEVMAVLSSPKIKEQLMTYVKEFLRQYQGAL